MKNYIILLLINLSIQGFSQITSYHWLRTLGADGNELILHLSENNSGSCILSISSPMTALGDTLLFVDTSLVGSNNYLLEFDNFGNIINSVGHPSGALNYATCSGFCFYSNYMYSIFSKTIYSPITYGSTTTNLITNSPDIYITKQDTLGNPISLCNFGNSGDDHPSKISIDNNGNVIVAGYYDSPALTFAGTTISNSGSEDAFIAKYDSLGNELWIKRIYSSDDDEPEALAVDEFGNIYYAQRTNSSLLNVDGNLLYANNSNGVSFLIKFGANGNFAWSKLLHSNASTIYDQNFICDVKIDNSNNVLVAAYSSALTSLFDSDTIWASNVFPTQPNCHNPLIAKLDSSGSILWKKYAITETAIGESIEPIITFDKDNSVYFDFYFADDTVYFDNDTIISPSQPNDMFTILSKFNPSGEKLWHNIFEQHFAYPRLLYIDDAYDIYISGVFNTMPSIQFDSLVSPSFYLNSNDIYVLKASQFIPAPDTTKQYINLNQGWSIISSYVDIYVADCDSVFEDVAPDMVLMKNETGQTFWPMYNVNTIGDLQIGEGYIIKMYNFNILEVNGIAVVPETTPLNLQSGWNINGYLRQNPGDIGTMLANISSNVYVVKNGNGLVYWPLYGINNIGNMNPGEGYQIKMTAADTLLYPAN